jgi:hypothetical protein
MNRVVSSDGMVYLISLVGQVERSKVECCIASVHTISYTPKGSSLQNFPCSILCDISLTHELVRCSIWNINIG